jgi:aspartate/methionine/tyrosine aminotransferase
MRLLEQGIACAPGSYFGAGGEGHVRFALVPAVEDCARAAERLAQG